ncbi:MAG: hypothetical protein RR628_02080 [Clostridium sp.]
MNNSNDCCCTCGLKKAICIINQLIDLDLVDSDKLLDVYYASDLSLSKSILKESLYPNLISLIKEENGVETVNIELCLEFLNAVAINPASDYQSIINILNKNYYHLLSLETPCDENCCCKNSFIDYFKDKYLQPTYEDRVFKLGVCGINAPIPTGDNKCTVIHLDYDVGWFLDIKNSLIYLVPLCKIYGAIK